MSNKIKPGTYAVEIQFELEDSVSEKTLDQIFESAMYDDFDKISSSDIGMYKKISKKDKR